MSERRSSLPGAAALLVVGAALLAFFLLRKPKVPEVAPKPAQEEPVATATAQPPPAAPPVQRAKYPQQVPEAVRQIPDDPDASIEARFRARIARDRALLAEKLRYPLSSQPLATKTDMLMPHQVDPSMHGLAAVGKVLVTQTQDRAWISPGQPAVVSITAKLDSSPLTLQIDQATVVRHLDGQPDAVVSQVSFTDSGSAPDAIAGDGTYTGLVQTPSDGVGASLTLTVKCSAGGESGTLLFSFVQTAAATASFTQTARDALEEGSIAIYVGVSVQAAGKYHIQGRLYDSTGAPIALLVFQDPLDTSATEVRLLAYGKLLLDEGGVPPFVLRDLEGWRIELGSYPGRTLMADWAGGYTTASYALSQLTGADYNGPDKQDRAQAIDAMEAAGLQDIANGQVPPGVSVGP
jgi:hypothetical protein